MIILNIGFEELKFFVFFYKYACTLFMAHLTSTGTYFLGEGTVNGCLILKKIIRFGTGCRPLYSICCVTHAVKSQLHYSFDLIGVFSSWAVQIYKLVTKEYKNSILDIIDRPQW